MSEATSHTKYVPKSPHAKRHTKYQVRAARVRAPRSANGCHVCQYIIS
jgi:hypothetical protein